MKLYSQGFTLIELLIGLTLFALLGVAVSQVVFKTTRTLVSNEIKTGLQSQLKGFGKRVRAEASFASQKSATASQLTLTVKTPNGPANTGFRTRCVTKPAGLTLSVSVPCLACNFATEIPVIEDLAGNRIFPFGNGADPKLPFAGGACFQMDAEIRVTLTGWIRDPKNPAGTPLMEQVKLSFPRGGDSRLQSIRKF